PEGRSDSAWIDFDLAGHQVVAHLDPTMQPPDHHRNEVDGHGVPVPHFGLVLDWKDWHELAERLRSAKTRFVIDPYVRFEGKAGEQATMFLLDPSGNALEFKAFRNPAMLFSTDFPED
ncbi:MAG: glyoxalase, partial [Planctomycetes bacterium]|nr:glyoxalase [Planctomycetota bacterium]